MQVLYGGLTSHLQAEQQILHWKYAVGRLARLTSYTQRNLTNNIDELYPDHAKALEEAKLFSAPFTKLKKVMEDTEKYDKKTKKPQSRKTYFCIGVCDAWCRRNDIHTALKNYAINMT